MNAEALAPPPIGHNRPPETPYEAIKAHVDDLEAEARNFLDGEPIATEQQAEAVAKLREEARRARHAAETQRKFEAKPFDEGKAAVQALWTPITDDKKGRCALIEATCGKVLSPWLMKLDEEQRAAAEAARLEAEEKAAAARATLQAVDPSNLADRIAAEHALEAAGKAERQAAKLDKAKPLVGGSERRTGLRTTYQAEITDPVLFGRWAWEHRRGEYLAFLEVLAAREARGGPKPIPGLNITPERKV